MPTFFEELLNNINRKCHFTACKDLLSKVNGVQKKETWHTIDILQVNVLQEEETRNANNS